ncbi:hypothetical protein C0992_011684 [Termitomyces sp. T32_za158]|nr:hypothetical protein C0992_011684 [Termitomyces sp. T32_za158]
MLAFVCPDQKNWVDHNLLVEFAINASVSETMGYAPFELNNGYMPSMIKELHADKVIHCGIMALHSWMEVDQEEERYKRQLKEVHHERYYQPVLSHCQAPVPTYARAVVPVMRREVAPQAQSKMGTDVLLQRLEAAGQPVPPTTLFLQDSLAIITSTSQYQKLT